MELDFQFDLVSTVFLIRDYQGKIMKYSRIVPNSFSYMINIGSNIYYDKELDKAWSKKSSLIAIEGCQYIQEEYTDVTDLWKQNKELLYQLKTDTLTKISNLKAVEEKKQEIINSHQSCSLVMCDLNNFKMINDVYGHLIGDQCLIEVASLFNHKISLFDLVARIGGDEFLFIFNSDNKEEVQEKMNEIQRDVEDLGKRLNLPLSVSVGISVFKPDDNWNEKRQEADEASYYHKRKTKSNRI